MPLSPALTRWLSGWGHDAVHCQDLGLHQATDAEILARAKLDRRIIMTTDLDFPRLVALGKLVDPALIVFRGGDWSDSDLTIRVGQLLSELSEADILGHIVVVDRQGFRRRALPIR